MIRRVIEPLLHLRATQFQVVVVTGPRQSGKTTLCRSAFPHLPYRSLEQESERQLAHEEPDLFLRGIRDGAVIDEVQRVPNLLSSLQVLVDQEPQRNGRFILTGSHNFLLMQSVSQSLAGRAALLTLLPLAVEELHGAGIDLPLHELLLHGGYPRIHDQKLPPGVWLDAYVSTYVERDVRELLAIGDHALFRTFLRLCAGRTAQLVNLSSLGSDCGVSHNTARSWISTLEASYLVRRLPPWHSNQTNRLVKAPKLHLLDSGLLCCLLGIQEAKQLETHPLRGAIFETFVFSEVLKARLNRGLAPDLWFLRDRVGHEIDLVIADAARAHAIEVKSSQTPFAEPLAAMERAGARLHADWNRAVTRSLVYAGETTQQRTQGTIRSWRDLANPLWATPAGM